MSKAPTELVGPADPGKRSFVRDMFTAIAPRYDLLNRVLSLSIDRRWRRQAVSRLEAGPAGRFLDVCAGTLDLSAELARGRGFAGSVVGADFVVPMLRLGRHKAARVVPVGADALELPFRAGAFDGCMVGFGVRNLADLGAGLVEIARVMKPGGRLVVLEFSTPRRWPIRPLYRAYFHHVLPRIGRLVSKHMTAYSYLPDSVSNFPDPDALADRLRAAGFDAVGYESLTFGIATLHWGVRV